MSWTWLDTIGLISYFIGCACLVMMVRAWSYFNTGQAFIWFFVVCIAIGVLAFVAL